MGGNLELENYKIQGQQRQNIQYVEMDMVEWVKCAVIITISGYRYGNMGQMCSQKINIKPYNKYGKKMVKCEATKVTIIVK